MKKIQVVFVVVFVDAVVVSGGNIYGVLSKGTSFSKNC